MFVRENAREEDRAGAAAGLLLALLAPLLVWGCGASDEGDNTTRDKSSRGGSSSDMATGEVCLSDREGTQRALFPAYTDAPCPAATRLTFKYLSGDGLVRVNKATWMSDYIGRVFFGGWCGLKGKTLGGSQGSEQGEISQLVLRGWATKVTQLRYAGTGTTAGSVREYPVAPPYGFELELVEGTKACVSLEASPAVNCGNAVLLGEEGDAEQQAFCQEVEKETGIKITEDLQGKYCEVDQHLYPDMLPAWEFRHESPCP
jgi:hypothetical protein